MTQRPGVQRARKRRVFLSIGASLCLVFGLWLWWWTAKWADLESLERLVRRRFPTIPQISTHELATILKTESRKPVLLDARESSEFDMGHLPGARNVAPGITVQQLELPLPKDTPVVAYCSVGYRSSALAKRMRDAGYTDVKNMEGGIFRWANEDRPLERNGIPTDQVHPYSNYWGRLVKPERRAPLPARK